MRKSVFGALGALGMLVLAPISVQAANITPNFDGAPVGWVVDRFQPNSFSDIGTFAGRDPVIGIGINAAQGFGSRGGGFDSTFYSTQGMKTSMPGGAGSSVSAGLYIDSLWAAPVNGSRRSDMWAVLDDPTANPDPHMYSIIGFTNFGGAPRLRVWDADSAFGWVDLVAAVAYDAWNDFAIEFTGTSVVYRVGGSVVYTDATIGGTTGFADLILQAFNFNGNDPATAGAVAAGGLGDYVALWSATPASAVPEPGTITLIGASLLGLGLIRRRQAA